MPQHPVIRSTDLRVAWRVILKDGIHSAQTVLGLGVAIAGALLVGLFLLDEFAHDRAHPGYGQTWRITQIPVAQGLNKPTASTPIPLHDQLESALGSDLLASTRIFNLQAERLHLFDEERDARFTETRMVFADPGFFRIFQGDALAGDPFTALDAPNSVVVSRSTATRWFGTEDALGRSIRFEGRFALTVTAVIEDPDPRSHVWYDAVASMSSLNAFFVGGLPDNWTWNPVWTYILLDEAPGAEDRAASAVGRIGRERLPDPLNREIEFRLQPMADIWLKSELEGEIRPVGKWSTVVVFLILGLGLLLIACLNTVNMAVARSSRRVKETTMRKVLGADTAQVVARFMVENALLTAMAGVLAVLAGALALPAFGGLAGKSFRPDALLSLPALGLVAIILVVVVLLSGLYPARQAVSAKPVGRRGTGIRRIILGAQFVLASVLMVGVWTVSHQLHHLQTKPLGFDRESVWVLPVTNTRLAFFFETFRERALTHPDVEAVALVGDVFGTGYQQFDYTVERTEEAGALTRSFQFVTPGFDRVFGLRVVAGRAFSDTLLTDVRASVMMNEAMTRALGYATPAEAVGSWVRRDDFLFTVVGVVNDHQSTRLHLPIEPLMFEIPKVQPVQGRYIHIRLKDGDPAAALAHLESIHGELDRTRQFDPFPLADRIAEQYRAERHLAASTRFFALLAVLVAAFGLFSLASYLIALRTKAIGIRKVLGAGIWRIWADLNREFTWTVAVAIAIGMPIGWWGAGEWLAGFANRSEPGWAMWIGIPVFLMAVAWASSAWQTYRAAGRNLVETLRYE